MTVSLNWHEFKSIDQLVENLAGMISRRLAAAVEERGSASWAVSGGATPAPLFDAMSKMELDWFKVQVALVDERWVEPGHPRSNETFIKTHLAKDKSARAHYIGMKTAHKSQFEAGQAVNERYGMIRQPIDSILLGMGPDGHTASFFPSAEGLEEALDPACSEICVPLRANKNDVTGEEVDRMSLSAAAIAASPHVVLMITGQEKKSVLEQALLTTPILPVARLARLKRFEIYWAP